MPVKVEILKPGNAAPGSTSSLNGRYRAAIYISATSWARNTTDTAAILAMQSEACRAYLAEHGELKKVKIYTDRNRVRDVAREWHHLLDDAECRKFDTVLTTSLGFVAESFATAGSDVGRFFYPAGIRFIAAGDDFDSQKDDIQAYLERCANMQSSYAGNKWREDRFARQKINKAAVPYGYRYVPDGHPQIVIDAETAPYVAELFEMAVAKTPVVEMARRMNACKAPTPKQRRGQLYGEKVTGSLYWKQAVVKNILKNPCYTGDYVTGRKREKWVNGVKTEFEVLPPEQWKVIRDYHEPIISREMYQKSLDVFNERSFVQMHGQKGQNAKRLEWSERE